jgi:hypothetical protein
LFSNAARAECAACRTFGPLTGRSVALHRAVHYTAQVTTLLYGPLMENIHRLLLIAGRYVVIEATKPSSR